MNVTLDEKYRNLVKEIRSYGSAAVAFSGGVDSTFLLKAAREALEDRVIAISAHSSLYPRRESDEAMEYCQKEGIRQFILHEDQLSVEGFSENPIDRCYICKKNLFSKLQRLAEDQGMAVVMEGSNADDTGDFRPGRIAVQELGIKSPMQEVGLTKEEIRILSKELGLPTWNKQSFACLATRIPYGQTITEEKLSMIDAAEQFLIDLGFTQLRVRMHAEATSEKREWIARIEVRPEEFPKLLEEPNRIAIHHAFHDIGFTYITMDLQGYRTGSMNETLSEETLEEARL